MPFAAIAEPGIPAETTPADIGGVHHILGIDQDLGIPSSGARLPLARTPREYWEALTDRLAVDWRDQFGEPDHGKVDHGATRPISGVAAGSAPHCLVGRIDADLRAWEVLVGAPGDFTVAEQIGKEMTSQFAAESRPVGRAYGTVYLPWGQQIRWMTWYADLSAASDKIGALFVFTAAGA